TTLTLKKEQWKEIVSGVDYTENFKKEEPKKKEPQTSKEEYTSEATKQYFTDLKYFMYAAVIVILIIVIVVLARSTRKKPEIAIKPLSLDSVKEIEENVHEVDLDSLLQEALRTNNYRLALRLNFLIVVKLLSQKGKITWAKEKTNWEYHLEIRDKLLADRFREIVISFESFWYGEHVLGENQYYQAEPLYKAIQDQLNPNG
ncbi:MAG: hypothetical protein JNL60_09025, partial [Bacteroidia bacterium]|nr:hypothetical protein [Bacteroidia bacterium]